MVEILKCAGVRKLTISIPMVTFQYPSTIIAYITAVSFIAS